ncbi:MM3350-like domain-containing protein [Cerioporus squamosus]|nr:MM3350-like domain-containing protein [Cerioporus squamosus]
MAGEPLRAMDPFPVERKTMSIIAPDSPRRFTPKGEYKEPAFVKFDPEDDAANLDEIFWEDPLTFTPRRCRRGYIEHWGLYPCDEDKTTEVPLIQIQTRKMTTQFIYDDKKKIRPELQFVNALIEKKVNQLAQVDLGDLPQRDYTLYIAHPFLEHPTDPTAHRYWRRIRVSGGLPLGVFADKVLTPLWGWVRNLHAHTFHDVKDGAMFGPKDCNSIDIMHHMDNAGYAYIPEESYCIAHILREAGDVMFYHYDFGDNWFLDIKVEDIAPVESSTGAVVVLAGRGGRLPDGDRMGTWDWQEPAHVLLRPLRHRGVPRRGARRARQQGEPPVREQDFITPIGEGSLEQLLHLNQVSSRLGISFKNLKKGTAVVQTLTGPNGEQFLEEGVNTSRRDNPANTACARCGSPHRLKACGRCGQRFYCGKECQTNHWKEKHKLDCKNPKKHRSAYVDSFHDAE